MAGPVVYSLTPLTGERRNENRRMVVLTLEVKRHTFLVSLFAGLASLPVVGLLFLVVNVWSLLAAPIFIGVALWLWDSRQRQGLKLTNYQAILDTRRAQNGVLYAAGAPIPEPQLIMHQQQTIPAKRRTEDTPLAAGAVNSSRHNARARKKRAGIRS